MRFPGSKSSSISTPVVPMQASASRSPALLDCAAALAADAGLVVALQDQLPGLPEQMQPWQQKHLGSRWGTPIKAHGGLLMETSFVRPTTSPARARQECSLGSAGCELTLLTCVEAQQTASHILRLQCCCSHSSTPCS